MSDSLQLLWTVARQTSLSIGILQARIWNGLPCPPPGDLPNPRTEPVSLMSPGLAGRFFTTSIIWERNQLKCRRPQFDSWVRKIPWRRERLPTPGFLSFPGGSDSKASAYNAGDPGLTPGLGRSNGEEKGYPLQYSWASRLAQLVKNPPAMRKTWVSSLRWEDPLEKG